MKAEQREATVDVWQGAGTWWWDIWTAGLLRAWNRIACKNQGAAIAEARRVMKRMGLVEKAK